MAATFLGEHERPSGSLLSPVTIGTAVAVGDVAVMLVGGVVASGTGAYGVTDSRGNTWTERTFQLSNTTTVGVFTCTVATALQVGDVITFAQGTSVANGYASAWSVPAGSTYLGATSSTGPATTGTTTSGGVAVGADPATLLSIVTTSRGSSTANVPTHDAPWVELQNGQTGTTTRKFYSVSGRSTSAAGTVAHGSTLPVNGAWGDAVVAYADPVTTPPDPTPGTVRSIWPGGQTDTTARVVSRLTGGTSVRLAVSASPTMSSPTYVAAQVPDADGYVTHDVVGLAPNARHYFRCADTPTGGSETLVGDVATLVTLQTAGQPITSRRLLTGGCIRTNSTSPAALESALARGFDLGSLNGDPTYGGQGSTDAGVHEGVYEAQIENVPALRALLAAGGGSFFLPSDHDTSNLDNADSNDAVGAAALAARKHITPMGPGNATATDLGRTDGRFAHYWLDIRTTDRSTGASADGPGKTMLGAAQEARFEAWIEGTAARWLIVHVDTALLGDPDNVNKTDWWPAYPTARAWFVGLLNTAVAAGREVIVVHGDSHALAYCTPDDNPLGPFTVVCAAGYDQDGGGRNLSLFTDSWNNASGDVLQYGTLDYSDDLETMSMTFSGWDAAAGVERVAYARTLATIDSPWSLWNGTTEEPLILEGVWNGTVVEPVTAEEVP